MRVLYLLPRAPLPANNGETIRNAALLRATRDVADVLDIVTLPQPAGPGTREGLDELRAMCDDLSVVGKPVGDYLHAAPSRVATVLGRPYHLSVAGDRQVREAIVAAVGRGRYDAVVASQLTMAAAVPVEVRDRTVFDTHNVETVRLGELLGASGLGRIVGGRVVRRIRGLERSVAESVAATLVCSDTDAAELRAFAPRAAVTVVPNGTDARPRPQVIRDGDPGPLLFLASLDYSANIDSLDYLIHDVMPLVRSSARLVVAGSNPSERVRRQLRDAPPAVEFLGTVPDAQRLMADSAALVVPLRVGGGTRLKVLEALGVGIPVVTTSKGAEGIPVVPDRDVLLGDTPSDLAWAIDRVLTEPATRARLVEAGTALVDGGFRWSSIGARLQDVLRTVAVGARRPQIGDPGADAVTDGRSRRTG